MADEQIKQAIASLTDLEKTVYDAMVRAVFCSTNQFDIKEAQNICGIYGNQFAGVISSLYKKGLYNYVGAESNLKHSKKTIYDEISPNGYEVRTDIGFVKIADEE